MRSLLQAELPQPFFTEELFQPSSGSTLTAPCLSCVEDSQADPSRTEQRGRTLSLAPLLTELGISPRHCWLWAVGARCWLLPGFSSTTPPGPSPRGCSPVFHLPTWVDMGITPAQGQHLAVSLAEPHEVLMSSLLKLSRSLWKGSLPSGVSTTALSVVPPANLLRVQLMPLSVTLMKK